MRCACHGFVRALVEGRIIVGAAAAAIAVVTSSILDLPPSPVLGAAIFAATVLIYDLDEFLDRRGAPEGVPRVVSVTAVIAVLVLVAALGHLRLATRLVIALGLPACTLYAIPLAFLGGARLKDHPLGKVVYVAVAVTTATVLLPCVEARVTPSAADLGIAAGWVFVTVLGNALACDLRDRERDALDGPRTAAVVLGGSATRRLLTAGNLMALPIALAAGGIGLVPCAASIPFLATPLALHILRDGAPAWAWGLLLDGVFLPMAFLAS